MRGVERKVYLQDRRRVSSRAKQIFFFSGEFVRVVLLTPVRAFLGCFLLSAMGQINPVPVPSCRDVLFLILVFYVEVRVSVRHRHTLELILSLVIELILIMDACEQRRVF